MFLDWLWQDYVLYDYYKIKFLKRIKAFGRKNMDAAKQNIRSTLHRAINQCHHPENATMSESLRHFCAYYNKGEYQMIDEVRDMQRKKSLEILLKSEEDKTIQR